MDGPPTAPSRVSISAASETAPSPRRALAFAWRQIGYIVASGVLVYSLVHLFDPPRLNWGDSGSDYNVMISGRNFAKYGFLKLQLTPRLMDPDVLRPTDSLMTYTHYPQLPDLTNGMLRKVFGFSGWPAFRLVALLLTTGSLIFAYLVILRYWGRQVAQVALALWVSNPIWIQHVDYLHHGPYGAFFGFGSIYFLKRWLDGSDRRAMVWTSVCLFFAYLSSYDYWIFTPLILAAMAWHAGHSFPRFVRALWAPALAAVFAVAAKVATNIWALGWSRFLFDLHYQSVERTTDQVVRTDFLHGMVPVFLGRVEREFTLLLLGIVFFWLVLPFSWGVLSARLHQRLSPSPLILLLAPLPFLARFPELWVAQYYPALMLVPFFAVGAAVLIVYLVGEQSFVARAVGWVMLAGLGFNAIDQTASFDRAFFDPGSIASLRRQLDSLAPRGQRVMTDHVFDHAYRYYFDRNIVTLIIHESFRLPGVMTYFSDPVRPEFASSSGALLVQHKHLRDEMFDKGYYWVLYHYRLWDAWGDPPRYRRFIDSIVAGRDSAITANAAALGSKVFENDYYALWRLRPTGAPRDTSHAR